MVHCYVCGRPVPEGAPRSRRKVRTGETVRKPARARFPVPTLRFGMRVVCPWCARRIDAERRREELAQYAELGVALFVLALVLLSHLL